MSLGYAEKLSYREDLGGQLGAPELFDSGDLLESKIGQLVALASGGSVCLLSAVLRRRTQH